MAFPPKLLSVSVSVAISGGFKLYVAFILAGIMPDLLTCVAATFIIYAVYTFDRAAKSKEDEINRGGLCASSSKWVYVVICGFLLTSIIILSAYSPLLVLFPLMMGLIYSKGIKIKDMSLKLKRGLGVKNLVVSFTWSMTIVLFLQFWIKNFFVLFSIGAFFFFKSFIVTVICDFRDIKGDSTTGLATLPVKFGEWSTKKLLLTIHMLLHFWMAIAVLLQFIQFEPAILIYSWMIGFFYILFYASSKSRSAIFREIATYGEWIIAVILRQATYFF